MFYFLYLEKLLFFPPFLVFFPNNIAMPLILFTLELQAIVWSDITATELTHVSSLSQFCLCIYLLKGHRSHR